MAMLMAVMTTAFLPLTGKEAAPPTGAGERRCSTWPLCRAGHNDVHGVADALDSGAVTLQLHVGMLCAALSVGLVALCALAWSVWWLHRRNRQLANEKSRLDMERSMAVHALLHVQRTPASWTVMDGREGTPSSSLARRSPDSSHGSSHEISSILDNTPSRAALPLGAGTAEAAAGQPRARSCVAASLAARRRHLMD